MFHFLIVVTITTYIIISFTSIRALFLKPPKPLFKMLLAMGLIFPTLVILYLFILLDIKYFQLLIIPAVVSIIGSLNWNCATVSEIIDYVHKLEYLKILSEQQNKYTLTSKVVLKYIDFNTAEVVEFNAAMFDWLVERKLNPDSIKIGSNWYQYVDRRQEWKVKNQSTACSGMIYTNQISQWKNTEIYFKWSSYPLSLSNKTFVVEWIDDSKSQQRITELENKLEVLDSTNKKLINIGFKKLLENINAE